jgi:3-methylfumaryl-CoA hydratase
MMQDWVDRSEVQYDVASAARVAGLRALLDIEDNTAGPSWPVGVLPPLAPWLQFQPYAPQSTIGADGHPRRDGASFLPPIDLPRRMWAGSRVCFLSDIPIGAPIMRRSTIISVTPKDGASGHMVFINVLHEISCDGRVAISEHQDIVYREASAGNPTPRALVNTAICDAARRVTPDPVLLFRYSALTFNAHRIHYDRDYAGDVEGYRGLVVHGPLVATLLLTHYLKERPGIPVTNFRFRAQSPLFDTQPFDLCLTGTVLEARTDDGFTAMRAEVNAP